MSVKLATSVVLQLLQQQVELECYTSAGDGSYLTGACTGLYLLLLVFLLKELSIGVLVLLKWLTSNQPMQ